MIVVSDASPLIALDCVGHLEILRDVFGRVLVPEAVQHEVEQGQEGGLDLTSVPWIEIRQVGDVASMNELVAANLDTGEAAALALALEVHADYLLVDERAARWVARQRGVEVVGVLGVLLIAKRRGVLPLVAPIIGDLLTRAGFRASPRLVAEVLEAAGEATRT